jgi:CheY-like chemotaxis protein
MINPSADYFFFDDDDINSDGISSSSSDRSSSGDSKSSAGPNLRYCFDDTGDILIQQTAPMVTEDAVGADSISASFLKQRKDRMESDSRYNESNSSASEMPSVVSVENMQTAAGLSAKNVLIVDDSIVVRKILCRLVSSIGATPWTAENGAEAVDLFTNKGEHFFDVILMDLHMPVMDGFRAILSIKTMETKNNKRDFRGELAILRKRQFVGMTDDFNDQVFRKV